MGNLEVIKRFLLGEKGATAKRKILQGYYYTDGRTLQTDGQQLINYNTVIAKRNGKNEIEIDADYYSNTTSKVQTSIIKEINKLRKNGYDIIVVLNGEQKRVDWLSNYLKTN